MTFFRTNSSSHMLPKVSTLVNSIYHLYSNDKKQILLKFIYWFRLKEQSYILESRFSIQNDKNTKCIEYHLLYCYKQKHVLFGDEKNSSVQIHLHTCYLRSAHLQSSVCCLNFCTSKSKSG